MAENASKNPPVINRAFAVLPQPTIDTRDQSRRSQARRYLDDGELVHVDGDEDADPADGDESAEDGERAVDRLMRFIEARGDISDLLDAGECDAIASRAVREWEDDNGSISNWREKTKVALQIADQQFGDDDSGDDVKDWPWENASDIHYPLLTVAANEWTARAGPELIKGDEAVGIKSFSPRGDQPSPQDVAAASQPQSPQDQQAAQAMAAQGQQQEKQEGLDDQAQEARGARVKRYLNWLLFYGMEDFPGDNDQMLTEIPVTGHGVMHVFMGQSGPDINYVSPMRFTVARDTKKLSKSPRLTRDYDIHPVDIESGIRLGIYRDVDLPEDGSDLERPRLWIEQWRYEDLDGDGLREPYIVTVDVETSTCMRIEPAFTEDDVHVDAETYRVLKIDRWTPFGDFRFLRNIRGLYYGTGLGKLLAPIADTVDTTINQLIDAGSAQIAGGGFIASGVKMRGAGAGGAVNMEPGEFKIVDAPGGNLREAIFERTVPQPSVVAMQMLELLIQGAKEISNTKDVLSGETPATAPVGTTMAVQQQALTGFTSIFGRVFQGYTQTYRLLYQMIKRYATDREREKYKELTGGDLDQDFDGDGTDIQPIADPRVVTHMQKMSRIQALAQWAEGPIGQAAGMMTPGPAQALSREALDVMEVDRPDRFFGQVQPNPELVAKTQDISAAAQLKQLQGAKAKADAALSTANATLAGAKTLRELGLAAHDTHGLSQEASRIASGETVHEEEQIGPDGAGTTGGVPPQNTAA